MAKDNYNWWEDPENKEKVERMSWWNHPENRDVFNLPISVVNDGDWWVATCNDETKAILGDKLQGCAQGKTKEEAVKKMFQIIAMTHDYSEERRLNYQRWVPFRKGPWKHTGGKWFVVFGIHVYFRYGKGMQGGRYIPLTKLNVSFSNEWTIYRKSQKNKK